jgi:hypothetical protein
MALAKTSTPLRMLRGTSHAKFVAAFHWHQSRWQTPTPFDYKDALFLVSSLFAYFPVHISGHCYYLILKSMEPTLTHFCTQNCPAAGGIIPDCLATFRLCYKALVSFIHSFVILIALMPTRKCRRTASNTHLNPSRSQSRSSCSRLRSSHPPTPSPTIINPTRAKVARKELKYEGKTDDEILGEYGIFLNY